MTNLGNGAIVDLDQVTRGRVDLEALVEGESGLDGLGGYQDLLVLRVGGGLTIDRLTILAHHFTSHDLLVEVSFTLLNTSREALLLGLIDSLLDGIALALGGSSSLLLLGAGLSALVSSEIATEAGLRAAAVIKVDGVSWKYRVSIGDRFISTYKRIDDRIGTYRRWQWQPLRRLPSRQWKFAPFCR